MKITVEMIAQIIGGQIEGDPQTIITGPARIEEATAGTITFLADMRYETHAYQTGASAILVHSDFQPKQPLNATLIRVPDVRIAIATLLEQFQVQEEASGIHAPQAVISPKAKIAGNVNIGAFSFIAEGAVIGEGSVIHEQVYIGADVKIGAHCTLYPGVKIYKDSILGDHCVIHSNTVIGADGFGFVPGEDGAYTKIPQVGRVRLGNAVEIGSNCSIDRASMGETVLEDGVKLDNLIQIAHNVKIGAHTVIAAQAGIAGSTSIGAHCMIGGQAGFAGHLKIADGNRFQAQSGVASSVEEPNLAFFGSPAIPYAQYTRAYMVFKRLPDLDKRVHRLERMLEQTP